MRVPVRMAMSHTMGMPLAVRMRARVVNLTIIVTPRLVIVRSMIVC